jgi:hypothetical protein
VISIWIGLGCCILVLLGEGDNMKKQEKYKFKSDTPELFVSILSRGYTLQYCIKAFCDVRMVKSIKKACETLGATHELIHSSSGIKYFVKLGTKLGG